MQNAYKHQANTLKTWMQQGNMKLHAKIKQVSYRAHSKRSNGSTHTLYTSYSNNLSKTATRHIASIKTISYRISTRKQKAWAWCTGKACQNMNTELSLEITRTCSNTHGKIANNNSSNFAENNIRLQCLELSNNMLQELNMANKGMAC